MKHTFPTEARNLLALYTAHLSEFRLTHVEGAEFSLNGEGLGIEAVGRRNDADGDPDFEGIVITVWNDKWMFGIEVQPQTTVTVTYEGPEDELLNVPRADRTNQFCSYGEWRDLPVT